MIHGKSENKFVGESYRIIMYMTKILFLFIVLLFIVGCSKTINVTGKIKLVSNDKVALLPPLGQHFIERLV